MKKMVTHDLMRVQITKISVYLFYPPHDPTKNLQQPNQEARLVTRPDYEFALAQRSHGWFIHSKEPSFAECVACSDPEVT